MGCYTQTALYMYIYFFFLKISGYVHKGVPIPSPPQEVLDLSTNYTEQVYLVLFFDVKRTWQWLPADKLEILGLDPERDEAKVMKGNKFYFAL